MALCHKCGSEFSDNEATCPTCGADAKKDLEKPSKDYSKFESTLFMSYPDDIKMKRAEQAMKELGEETLENPMGSESPADAKTLETVEGQLFAPTPVEVSQPASKEEENADPEFLSTEQIELGGRSIRPSRG